MAAIILVVMLVTKLAQCESIPLVETRYDHSYESPGKVLPRYRVRVNSLDLLLQHRIVPREFDEPYDKVGPVTSGIK